MLRLPVAIAAAVLAGAALAPVANASGADVRAAVAQRIGDQNKLSAGFRMWLAGPPADRAPDLRRAAASVAFGSNVDAADPNEDLAGGQAETAIDANAAGDVVDAFNDATGFLYFDSTTRKASLTGVGLSTDGGMSFTDLVGLKNLDPQQQWFGDPGVVALDATHFLVSSLYLPSLTACQVEGDVSQATVAVELLTVRADGSVKFGKPIVVSPSGNICDLFFSDTTPAPDLASLDKDSISYDPQSRTLALGFTRFFLGIGGQSGNGQIEVARATVPANPAKLRSSDFSTIVVWPEEPFCPPGVVPSETIRCNELNQGAGTAVAPGGATFVAWERNLETNLFFGDPYVYEHAALIPAGASAPSKGGPANPVVLTRGQQNAGPNGGVRSLDSIAIAGYNRGIGNDFPSITADPSTGGAIVEWNDASQHPLGDIFLRSVTKNLATQPTVKVNDDASFALHFLPAVSIRSDGVVCSSWYDRRVYGGSSTLTDYWGDCGTPVGTDFPITTGPTDWNGTSTLTTPNFGDYTDNASSGTTTYYTWTDGRIGVPQPFVDHSGS